MPSITRAFYEQLQSEEFKMTEDYSGGWMFGETCVGLTGSVRDLAWFSSYVTNWLAGSSEDPTDEVDYNWVWDNLETDSMGLDEIFYWPGVTVEKEGEKDGS